jgi:hypothetical protein
MLGALVLAGPRGANAVCGDGVIDNNEQCDGGPCCTAACVFAPNFTPCGIPSGPCRIGGACFDFECFVGSVIPDGTPCDDGDACTTRDVCRNAQCVPGTLRCSATPKAATSFAVTPANQFRVQPGTVVAELDCSAAGGAGGTCSAAAFLPKPSSTANLEAAPVTTADISCDFTRQITRTASSPLDTNGMAHLKLKLNKLARRLVRKLPVTDAVQLTVCTKIDFPSGETITLVDVVNVARK